METTDELPAEVDVVVVGTGAAGGVVAARLAEDPSCTVLAVEAGQAVDGPQFRSLATAFEIQQVPDAPWLWGEVTTPQPGLGGRSVPVQTGRALGGGSAVNSMTWIRGFPADFDGWAAAGADGWGWDAVRPVFDAIDGGGPDAAGARIAVEDSRETDVFAHAFTDASRRLGLADLPYVGAPAGAGVGPCRTNSHDGARHSVLDGYLLPAWQRPNLTVLTGRAVDRVLVDGGAVTGVRLAGSDGREVRARRVVLAAGALHTPAILLRSGVGPAGHLAEHGVPVVHDLPGVGANLHDHALVPCVVPSRDGAEAPEAARRPGSQDAGALLQTTTDAPAPDLQVILTVLRSGPGGTPFDRPVLSVSSVALAPHSRGSVRLASADPDRPPLVDPGYLADDRDRAVLRRGLDWVLDGLFADPSFRAVCDDPVLPAPGVTPDEHLTAQARSTNHPVGSCRMGTDPDAVVGPDLAVHGITGLTVADASVMPSIVRGNTQAATIMIGERAAEVLRAG